MDIERFGLRDGAYPFDWVISDFQGVVEAIESDFSGWLEYDLLSQNVNAREQYRNDRYNIKFFHDFNKHIPLKEQLDAIEEKYQRRISRFYKAIEEPTLFVRYISDTYTYHEGSCGEIEWIETNYQRIVSLIKSYNSESEIIFIGNDGIASEMFEVFNVTPDENDVVARNPANKNEELSCLLANITISNKEDNIRRYKEKMKRKQSGGNRARKYMKNIQSLFLKEYIHSKIY